MSLPFVSVIIPCRNEEIFIAGCLDSLLNNDYPGDLMEILVIDGQSTDGTLVILNRYLQKHTRIRVITNEKRTFPAAVNTGIKNSKGDYLLIAGAHAIYPSEYISDCIRYGQQYNSDNTGGILETVSIDKGFAADMITGVLSNPFGVGNSRFRTGSGEITETDTVFGGCYKKEVFDKWGFFNEKLVSTSDYEFNRRIKKEGARILLVPSIKATYYTRSTIPSFLKNNFRNGYWAIYPIAVTNHFPVSFRHLVPLIFTVTVLTLASLSFTYREALILLSGIGLAYIASAFYFSIKDKGKKVPHSLMMPVFFVGLHLSYGAGSIFGAAGVIKSKLAGD